MNRTTVILLSAGLLGVMGIEDAHAGIITFSSIPFVAPETTNFRSFTTIHSLPYTDSYGNTISTNGGTTGFISGLSNGLNLAAPPGPVLTGVVSATFALSAPTNQIGFNFLNESSTEHLISASFNNGDSFTGGASFTTAGKFQGYIDTTSFTSVTLTFTGDSGLSMDDFRVASAAAVPEPSTISLGAAMATIVCVAA